MVCPVLGEGELHDDGDGGVAAQMIPHHHVVLHEYDILIFKWVIYVGDSVAEIHITCIHI